jgi:hypothetical protein
VVPQSSFINSTKDGHSKRKKKSFHSNLIEERAGGEKAIGQERAQVCEWTQSS